MKTMIRVVFICLGLILCPMLPGQALAEESELIVVASQPTYDSAIRWSSFLEVKEIPVKHITASEFEGYKKEQYIVVMGIPTEPGEGDDLLKALLTEDEYRYVGQQGNRNIYIKSDVWNSDQTIIVFAGYNRAALNSARADSKEEWWTLISGWFDIEFDLLQLYGY